MIHDIKIPGEIKLSQKIVPQYLLNQFISMTDPYLERDVDCHMPINCARSLPAVVLTLGRENFYCLKDLLRDLATHCGYEVRKIVASYLHELAIILGPEMTSKYLSPIFNGFVNDSDQVSIEVLNNLSTFLKVSIFILFIILIGLWHFFL